MSTIDRDISITYADSDDFPGQVPPQYSFLSAFYPITITDKDVPLRSTTLASRITAEASAIVGWNVQITTSSTSNSITSQINSNIFSSFTTQTHSSTSASGHRLSSGAKAGIGVFAGVGILIFITLIAWTVILKRRNRSLLAGIETTKESQTRSHGTDPSCEHCDSQTNELGHESLRELGGSQINELSHRSLCELNPISVPVEMSIPSPKTSIVR